MLRVKHSIFKGRYVVRRMDDEKLIATLHQQEGQTLIRWYTDNQNGLQEVVKGDHHAAVKHMEEVLP